MRAQRLVVLAGFVAFITGASGCNIGTPGIEAAAGSIERASKNLTITAEKLETASKVFDPGNFRGTADEIKKLREALEKKDRDLEAYKAQLVNELPMSACGTYTLSSPKGPGPTGKVSYKQGFEFEFSIVGSTSTMLIWDKKSQMFIGDKVKGFFSATRALLCSMSQDLTGTGEG
jgi:hypothetical protein